MHESLIHQAGKHWWIPGCRKVPSSNRFNKNPPSVVAIDNHLSEYFHHFMESHHFTIWMFLKSPGNPQFPQHPSGRGFCCQFPTLNFTQVAKFSTGCDFWKSDSRYLMSSSLSEQMKVFSDSKRPKLKHFLGTRQGSVWAFHTRESKSS